MLAEVNALQKAVTEREVDHEAGALSSGTQDPGGQEILSVEGVRVRLCGRQILDDVGFRIRPGEFTGLIGSNGAGKTTLLRVILGLQARQSGTVRVGGQPRCRRNPLIGYVPQKFLLDPDMPLRARDLVGLGPRRATARDPDAVSDARAADRRDARGGRRAGVRRAPGSATCPAASSSGS